MSATARGGHTVALVTLGCARNDADSEELAGRLEADGFRLVDDPARAETVLVNTCGFIESAKKDSIDTLLAAADLKGNGRTRSVVAVGCLAERYGVDLADALPEADAVLSFDDYESIGARVRSVLTGTPSLPHPPHDRRTLLPVTPVHRHAARHRAPATHGVQPTPFVGPSAGPRPVRRRLDGAPMAPLRLASGCDRRCSFCAIPRFRGAFISRPPNEILAEAAWLSEHGVRELFLVSENSTSYGKDLGDLQLLDRLLPQLAAIDGIARVRVSYLQPAEMRPGLIDAMTATPGVAPYFDLSFQHASERVLRRMRRFGNGERFLELIDLIRTHAPQAGLRSNVIVGFPGETESDVRELERFLADARLDGVGVFGYSDEDGTEAADFDDKVAAEDITERIDRVSALADELIAQRAEDRVGEHVTVLVEGCGEDGVEGRADHQGPEVDGTTTLLGRPDSLSLGALVRATVVESSGADLVAEIREVIS
jgi:ribosomal protein S12 methylthiotransferase